MRKFLAVTKREYKKIVFTWTFLIGTLLAPLLASMFAIVPMLIFSIKGNVLRIAVVQKSGNIAERIKQNLSANNIQDKAAESIKNAPLQPNHSQEEQLKTVGKLSDENFYFVDFDPAGKSVEQIRQELNQRIKEDYLDAYIIIPENFDSPDAVYDYYSRNSGDFVTNSSIEDAVNDAVLSERLAKANISEARLKELSQKIKLDVTKVSQKGEEKDTGGAFGGAFVIGLLIYITLAIYGQAIMGAVVEEKETRIAEILFSSAKPFVLMVGKLVGVGLAGLTQLAIWITSVLVLFAFGATTLNAAGMPISMPHITLLTVAGFFIFFILGFFIYATIYALIGSMVTSVQEGGQFAFPPVMILLLGFYCIFPVTRDPNSTFSFWVSVAPFIAPIVMPVRIMTETPPFWQIGLAILLNLLAIFGLVWLASRVYRVGMLMTGKRATLPEVWKWIRQS